jgi:acyl-CoA synthetase (AMP-forming)/AMP-acid ligase II/aryl carrier-like protein
MRAIPLIDLLWERAASPETADRPAYTFLLDGEADEVTWTWRGLARRARAVAVEVSQRCAAGDRVLLLYPQGLDYLAALFGCMAAGVLAVPLQPPGRHRAKSALPKLEAIAADGGVALALTTAALVPEMEALVAASPSLGAVPWLASDAVPAERADEGAPRAVAMQDVAYLQYTSGSTSTPKGVAVTYANLAYNLFDFDQGYEHDADSVMVTWLPTFHDLGLVYGVFMPLYVGFRCVLLDPLHFLARPLRWLEAIHRFRGTHAAVPNFTFDLCVAKSTPEARAALDLRSWKVALNGAEPIRFDSEAAFVEAFSTSGVTWATLSHAYGMSEATACISKERRGTPRVWWDVDEAALARHRVVRVAAGAPGSRRIAGCGACTNQTRVVVAHPDTLARASEEEVGELWVGGPTCARGYWNQPHATRETFGAHLSDTGEGPFLRTGDMGFMADGQVFVTGRLKDLVIVRGENHYPQDLEWSVQQAHAVVRPSCVAAFTWGEGELADGVAVVAEVYAERLTDPEGVFAAVREALSEHGLVPELIALVGARAVFKTSSGKIMRRRTREALASGELEVLARWERPRALALAPDDAASPPDLAERLQSAPEGARRELLTAHIQARAAALLGLPADAIDPDGALREAGVDSVQAVELADALTQDLGRPVDVTALFAHPTPVALAEALLRAPHGAPPTPASGTTPSSSPAPASDADLDALGADDLAALLRDELDDL